MALHVNGFLHVAMLTPGNSTGGIMMKGDDILMEVYSGTPKMRTL